MSNFYIESILGVCKYFYFINLNFNNDTKSIFFNITFFYCWWQSVFVFIRLPSYYLINVCVYNKCLFFYIQKYFLLPAKILFPQIKVVKKFNDKM